MTTAAAPSAQQQEPLSRPNFLVCDASELSAFLEACRDKRRFLDRLTPDQRDFYLDRQKQGYGMVVFLDPDVSFWGTVQLLRAVLFGSALRKAA